MTKTAFKQQPAGQERHKERAAKQEAHRIQFQFTPDAYERMQKLREEVGASTYAELVRNALRIYEWLHKQEQQGYSLGLVKDDELVKEIKFVL